MKEDIPIVALRELKGNEPTSLNAFQQVLLPYVHEISVGWFVIWCVTLCVLLIRLVREYLEYRKRSSV
jgi:hypothetical protein